MQQYLDMVRHILTKGNHRGDRTGTGTQSVFGYQNRYDLQAGFPLMTTKFVPIRLVAEELLWFLSGSTDNKVLANKNVHIWDDWALKDRLPLLLNDRYEWLRQKLGDEQYALQTASAPLGGDTALQHLWLNEQGVPADRAGEREGELGPVYGAQWRSWPSKISQKTEDDYRPSDGKEIAREYAGGTEYVYYQETIDQVAELIAGLKERPYSRRHIISAWNPANLPIESQSHDQNVREGRQALPPCHCLFQFYVRERSAGEMWNVLVDRGDSATLWSEIENVPGAEMRNWFESKGIPTKALSCQLYQRSADVFLGVPFNIASYALLTEMIAQCVGMVADEFIHTFGDLHAYQNHREQLELQLSREPYPLPRLKLNPAVKDIFSFTMADIEVIDYQHHPAIKGKVAV